MWSHLSPLAAIVQAHYDLNVSPLLPHPSFTTGVVQQHVCWGGATKSETGTNFPCLHLGNQNDSLEYVTRQFLLEEVIHIAHTDL